MILQIIKRLFFHQVDILLFIILINEIITCILSSTATTVQNKIANLKNWFSDIGVIMSKIYIGLLCFFILIVVLSFFPIPPFIFLLPLTAPITIAISGFLTTITPLISSYSTAVKIYTKIPTIIRNSLPELPTTDTAFTKFRNYILINIILPIIIFLTTIILAVINDSAITNLTVENFDSNIQSIYTRKIIMIGTLLFYFSAKVYTFF